MHFARLLWLFYLNFFYTASNKNKFGLKRFLNLTNFELFFDTTSIKKTWRWCHKNLEVVSNPEIRVFFWRRRHHFFGGGGVSRNRLYWSINAWIHTSRAFHLHRLQLEIVYIDPLNKTYDFPQPLANGHITLNTPVLVRSLKLSSVEPSQCLNGWPPLVIFRVPGSNPGTEFSKICPSI